MAIRITQTPKFRAKDIVIEIANERGGWDKNTMDAIFRRVDTEEAKELEKVEGKELILRTMVSWDKVEDDDKQPVPFSEENLTAMLLIPAVVLALVKAFWSHQFKARTGN